jgi:hypothetical protein
MLKIALMALGTGCLPHTNLCDPATDGYTEDCVDTAAGGKADTDEPAVTEAELVASFAIDVEAAHGMVLFDAMLWVADWESSFIVALSPEDGTASGDTVDMGAHNPVDLAFDGTEIWALTQGGDLLEFVEDEPVERASLSTTEGIAFDGEYICAASSSVVYRVRDNGSTIFSTPIAGPGGPIGFLEGRFVQASSEGSGGQISLQLFDAESRVSSLFLDEVSVDVEDNPNTPISGIVVGTSHVYLLIGSTASHGASVLTVSLPSDWL